MVLNGVGTDELSDATTVSKPNEDFEEKGVFVRYNETPLLRWLSVSPVTRWFCAYLAARSGRGMGR